MNVIVATTVGVLTIVFVGLKLTDHIDWSWWWVLSPLWISVLLAVVIFFCAFMYGLLKPRF